MREAPLIMLFLMSEVPLIMLFLMSEVLLIMLLIYFGWQAQGQGGRHEEKAWQRRAPSQGRRPSAKMWLIRPSLDKAPEKGS
jgi:hypothetical protein